jgi:(1->4)-alpha-D-glucan 1-alpha-D-glucosylmutase
MLGTSTHDSKRGEDLRARIDVLSEDLTLWHTYLERVTSLAQMFERDTPAGKAPTRNDVWLLFQTLAGLWPAEPPDEAALADLRERVQAYMVKAVREAKLSTSWTWPNEEYEAALAHYIDSVLRPGANPFADELQRLTSVIAPFGFRNSLSQLALKLTVPGVPDIYQGCEQWNFSLVDPDNRRPVDFALLTSELHEIKRLYEGGAWPAPSQWTALWQGAADGRVKLLSTWRLLQLRQSMPELFRDGGYLPLTVDGPAADHALAFARTGNGRALLVVATRLSYRLCAGEAASWRGKLWSGTQIATSETQAEVRHVTRWRNWLTGASVDGSETGGGVMALDEVFAGAHGLPFAVLVAA